MAPRRQSKRLSSRASDVSSASNSKKQQQQQHEEEDSENHSQSTGVSARATRARVMLEEFDKEGASISMCVCRGEERLLATRRLRLSATRQSARGAVRCKPRPT